MNCRDCTEAAKGPWYGYSAGTCEACMTRLEADAAEHRRQIMECLARHVLSKPTRAERVEWLQSFEKRRGREAADQLRAVILTEYDNQKERACKQS